MKPIAWDFPWRALQRLTLRPIGKPIKTGWPWGGMVP